MMAKKKKPFSIAELSPVSLRMIVGKFVSPASIQGVAEMRIDAQIHVNTNPATTHVVVDAPKKPVVVKVKYRIFPVEEGASIFEGGYELLFACDTLPPKRVANQVSLKAAELSWPYFKEFVGSCLARMMFPPLWIPDEAFSQLKDSISQTKALPDHI